MSQTGKLGLYLWQPGTSSPQSFINDAHSRLDIFASNTVISRSTAAQPVSPTVGDAYIIPASATGTQWAGFTEGDLAVYTEIPPASAAWVAIDPVSGLPLHVQDTGEVVQWSGADYSVMTPRTTILALSATSTADPSRDLVASTAARQSLLMSASTTGTLTINASAQAGYAGDVWLWIYNNSGVSITAVDGTGWQDTTFSQAIADGETLAVHGYWDSEKLYVVNTYLTTGDDRPT